MFAGACLPVGTCPEGEVQYTRLASEPPHQSCGTSCPEGLVVRLGVCIGRSTCSSQGGTFYNDEECVEQCPEEAVTYNSACYARCSTPGTGDQGDGTCGSCPYGQVGVGGACVDACPEGTLQESNKCVAACTQASSLGWRPLRSCRGLSGRSGPDRVSAASGPQCADSCPDGQVELAGGCIGRAYSGGLSTARSTMTTSASKRVPKTCLPTMSGVTTSVRQAPLTSAAASAAAVLMDSLG